MVNKSFLRVAGVMATIMLLALALGGCGNDEPKGAETGTGAPSGAKGDAAGGAAVEAGKERNPADVENEKRAYGTEPPPVQINVGAASGWKVDKPTLQIIHTNSELNALKKKLRSKLADVDSIVPIDFKTRQLFVVQMPKLPGGSVVQISQVRYAPGNAIVEAVKITPGKGCKTSRTGNPYHVVETRRLEGTARLKLKTMRNDPCD